MVEQQNEQLTLALTNDNLTCRLGWYYDPERTTTKSGQAIKKRPTYRLCTKYQGYTIGNGDIYIVGSILLDAILDAKRKPRIVLFFDDDNWQRINTLLQNSLEQKQFLESLQQTALKPLNDIPPRSVLRTMLTDFWNWLLGKE